MGNRISELAAFEHLGINQTSGLKRVLLYGLDDSGDPVAILVNSGGGLATADSGLTQAIAYGTSGDADGKPEYIGVAAPSSAKGSLVWSIKKLTYNASGQTTDIQWADGTAAFTKEWDERATYTYS